jgi:hypothetical protein
MFFLWWVPRFCGTLNNMFCFFGGCLSFAAYLNNMWYFRCFDGLICGFIGMFKLNGMPCDSMFSALCAVLCLDGLVQSLRRSLT